MVSGALKQRIGDSIIAARGAGEKPDPDDSVNNYRTGREEVDTFTRWYS